MSGAMICRTNVVKCIDDWNWPMCGGTGRREVDAGDVSLGEMRDGLWGQSIDSETGNTWQPWFIPRYPARTAFFKKHRLTHPPFPLRVALMKARFDPPGEGIVVRDPVKGHIGCAKR